MFFEPVIRPPDVLERPLGGICACPCPAGEVVRLGLQAPRAREAELVAELLEDGDRTVGSVDQLVRRDVGFREQAQEASLDECAGGQSTVAGRRGSFHRLGEHAVCPAHIAAQALHDSDVGDQFDPEGIIRGQQCGGPCDQVHPGGRVAANERPSARAPESLGRLPCERSRSIVDGAQLDSVAVRLLEVVADDLFVFDRALPCGVFEPAAEPFVELGSRFLRDRVVGGVTDEEMPEAVRAIAQACPLGANQVLANKRPERVGNCRNVLPAKKAQRPPLPGRPCPPPRPARSPPARVPSSWSSRAASRAWIVGGTRTVEISPAAAQRPSSRTSRPSSISIESISSTKSGLPSAASAILVPHSSTNSASADEILDQLRALLVRERFEQRHRRVELAASPGRTHAEKLGPGKADEQDGCVAHPVGEVFDEVEERGLTPVNVVEDEHQRLDARQRLE